MLLLQLKAANVVPPSLAPCTSMDLNVLEYMQRTESKGSIPEYKKQGADTEGHKLPPKPELTPNRLNKLFSKLDFCGMEEWPEDIQQQVVELFKEYHHIFVLTHYVLMMGLVLKEQFGLSKSTA